MDAKNLTISAFLELLPPTTREQIAATAEKYGFDVINAVAFTFNVAQHRTLSGRDIASMASALSYTEHQKKKNRKNLTVTLELPAYEAVVKSATRRGLTISAVINRVIYASGLYYPFADDMLGPGDK